MHHDSWDISGPGAEERALKGVMLCLCGRPALVHRTYPHAFGYLWLSHARRTQAQHRAGLNHSALLYNCLTSTKRVTRQVEVKATSKCTMQQMTECFRLCLMGTAFGVQLLACTWQLLGQKSNAACASLGLRTGAFAS